MLLNSVILIDFILRNEFLEVEESGVGVMLRCAKMWKLSDVVIKYSVNLRNMVVWK